MKNLMTYIIEYSSKSFSEHPFNVVDALVLCQIVYLKLDGIVPGDAFVSWQEIAGHPESEKLYSDRVFGEMYREFFANVTASERYRGIEAGFFEEHYSGEECDSDGYSGEKKEYQFAALTYRIPDASIAGGRIFIAYRGTDEKLVGWKEDLNMGFSEIVPSQEMALEYLERVASITMRCEGAGSSLEAKRNRQDVPGLFIGGHSKGGRQAVYAAAKASGKIKEQIAAVYSFDGMGLGDEFYASKDYREIKHKTTKIIPDESLVGTLFERPENCIIVESGNIGIKQHDFMNWRVEDGHFVYCETLKPAARIIANRLRRWMIDMSEEEARHFVDIIYEMMLASEPNNIYDLTDKRLEKIKAGILILCKHGKPGV